MREAAEFRRDRAIGRPDEKDRAWQREHERQLARPEQSAHGGKLRGDQRLAAQKRCGEVLRRDVSLPLAAPQAERLRLCLRAFPRRPAALEKQARIHTPLFEQCLRVQQRLPLVRAPEIAGVDPRPRCLRLRRDTGPLRDPRPDARRFDLLRAKARGHVLIERDDRFCTTVNAAHRPACDLRDE